MQPNLKVMYHIFTFFSFKIADTKEYNDYISPSYIGSLLVHRLLGEVLSSSNNMYSKLDVAISLAYEEVCQWLNVKFQKISIPPPPPHRKDWNFLGGGKFCKAKNLKKCMNLNWNFQRGGRRSYKKSFLLGRYGYFLELCN